MKIAIAIKRGDENNPAVSEFISELDRACVENYIFDGGGKPDALVVFGGDGTILRYAEYAVKNDLPLIGINSGTIGFLSAYETSKVKTVARLLSEDKIRYSERSVLTVTAGNKKYIAVNDAVVERCKAEVGSVVSKLSLNIGGEEVYDLRSDGIIIATPTGSTAYSLSAGGVILSPDIKSFIATPICPHSLTTRPIVYGEDKKVLLKINESSCDCILSCDGKPALKLSSGDTVCVEKNDGKLTLAESGYNFFKKINRKLG